jgi:hypothetical protein
MLHDVNSKKSSEITATHYSILLVIPILCPSKWKYFPGMQYFLKGAGL